MATDILMQHNIETFEDAMQKLKEHGRVAVVKPTGTGKSYIAMQIMRELGNVNKIVIAPSKIFLTSLEENEHWDRENSRVYTYSYIGIHRHDIDKVISEHMSLDSVGLIVLDEMHRAGAKYWGEGVNKLIRSCKNAKLLGLTATSKRERDGVDMVDELFNGISVGNQSLRDAIDCNILPKIKYVVGVNTVDLELSASLKGYNTSKFILSKTYGAYKEVRDKWNSDGQHSRTMGKHLNPEGKAGTIGSDHPSGFESKHIVFIKSLAVVEEELTRVRSIYSDIYPGHTIDVMCVTSKHSKEDNACAINKFSGKIPANTIYVMVAVRILNESFHFDEIKSICMFRETAASAVYLQQIGRCLSVGAASPYVFDFVDNFERVGDIALVAGGDSKKDIGVAFESFTDETSECLKDIQKLKYAIMNATVFHTRALKKHATEYEALQLIPDKALREWAIGRYHELRTSTDTQGNIVKDNPEAFEITSFLCRTNDLEWYNNYKGFNGIGADEKEAFKDKAIQYYLRGVLSGKLLEGVEGVLGASLDSLISDDYLYSLMAEGIDNGSNGKVCGSVLRLIDTERNQTGRYELYDYFCLCRDKFAKYNTTSFGSGELPKAAAYMLWERSKDRIENSINATEAEKAVYKMTRKKKPIPSKTISTEEFRAVNSEILIPGNAANNSFILGTLRCERSGAEAKLVELLDYCSQFSYKIDRALFVCYILATETYKFEVRQRLIDEVKEFIRRYSNMEMHYALAKKYRYFEDMVLPVVACICSDGKDFGEWSKLGVRADYASSVANAFVKRQNGRLYQSTASKESVRERSAILGKLVSIMGCNEDTAEMLRKDKKQLEEFISDYANEVRELVETKYEGVVNGGIELTMHETNMLILVYYMLKYCNMGLSEYDGILEVTYDADFVHKIDSMLLNRELCKAILDISSVEIGGGAVIGETVLSGLRYGRLSANEHKKIDLILDSGINRSRQSSFYDALKYIRLNDLARQSLSLAGGRV